MRLQAVGGLAVLRLARAPGKGRLCDWAEENVSAEALLWEGHSETRLQDDLPGQRLHFDLKILK